MFRRANVLQKKTRQVLALCIYKFFFQLPVSNNNKVWTPNAISFIPPLFILNRCEDCVWSITTFQRAEGLNLGHYIGKVYKTSRNARLRNDSTPEKIRSQNSSTSIRLFRKSDKCKYARARMKLSRAFSSAIN